MLLRVGSLVVWALVAASAVFWGLRLFGSPVRMPAGAQVAAATPSIHAELSRLLGSDAPPPVALAPPPDSRYHLIGVVTPRPAGAAREGLALIVVDGKPARAFRVGAAVDETNVLQAVSARGATIGPSGGEATAALTIAAPAPAATGTLPNAGNGAESFMAPSSRLNRRLPPPVPREPPPQAPPAEDEPTPNGQTSQ